MNATAPPVADAVITTGGLLRREVPVRRSCSHVDSVPVYGPDAAALELEAKAAQATVGVGPCDQCRVRYAN